MINKLLALIISLMSCGSYACVIYQESLGLQITESIVADRNECIDIASKCHGKNLTLSSGKYSFFFVEGDDVYNTVENVITKNSRLIVKRDGGTITDKPIKGSTSNLVKIDGFIFASSWEPEERLCTTVIFDKDAHQILITDNGYVSVEAKTKNSLMLAVENYKEILDGYYKKRLDYLLGKYKKNVSKIYSTWLPVSSHGGVIYTEYYFMNYAGAVYKKPASAEESELLGLMSEKLTETAIKLVRSNVPSGYLAASSAVRLMVKTNNKKLFCTMASEVPRELMEYYAPYKLWDFWFYYINGKHGKINCRGK